MLKIIFMGTPDFAVPSLAALHNAGYDVTVFTQPDRPVGRGNKVSMPAVKKYAIENDITVYQYDSVKSSECVELMKSIAPDLMVTAAFGQILTREILDIPKMGCVNVHGSLLPKYRGAAPIQWAIIKGEKETGITTMLTDCGVDTGDILLQEKIQIEDTDTAESLFDKLSVLGADTLLKTISGLLKGTIKPIKQDALRASYYPMIKKSAALIDFSKTAQETVCFVRGMYSWPIAYMVLKEGLFKIHKAHAIAGNGDAGTVVFADSDNGLIVACSEGLLSVDVLQAPGGKAMNIKDYLRGHSILVGQVACEVNDER